jgi:uncharacterized protein YecT (DUF1311 family)
MGIQLVITVLFVTTSLSSLAQQKKMASDAKGYLYYYCVKEEFNAIDSNKNAAYNRDYSGSYFVQMTDLPIQILDSLQSYYKRNIKNYRGVPQENSFDSIANMTCWSCWSLCEGKRTQKFIKHITKRSKGGK